MNEYESLFWDPTLNNGKGELTIIGTLALMIIGVEIFFTLVELVLHKKEK